MTLVVDASVAVSASFHRDGFARLALEPLVAPALMWSEARSTLRLGHWRGEIDDVDASMCLDRLEACPIESKRSPELGFEAWRVSVELGWARTYDAEYIALARMLDCRLVTLDRRMRRGTDRFGFVVTPEEL